MSNNHRDRGDPSPPFAVEALPYASSDFQLAESPSPVEPSPPPNRPAITYPNDPLLRMGVSYRAAGPCIEISIPTSCTIHHRLIWCVILAAPLFLGSGILMELIHPTRPWRVWDTITAVALLSAATAFAWIVRRRTVGRAATIVLNDSTLILDDFDGAGRPRSRRWPRALIADIRAGPVPWAQSKWLGLGLHIRITGKTIFEVLPGHPSRIARAIADRLNEALAFESAQCADGRPAGSTRQSNSSSKTENVEEGYRATRL